MSLFQGGSWRQDIHIWIHVDDTFVASANTTEIKVIQEVLRKKFEITVSDDVDQYLGVQMVRLSAGSVKLTQPKLLEEDNPDLTSVERGVYQHLLGALMYLLKSSLPYRRRI
jgi:hypothetical protein